MLLSIFNTTTYYVLLYICLFYELRVFLTTKLSHQNHPSTHPKSLPTPKFLPCVFFFFFEKRREIPPPKKLSLFSGEEKTRKEKRSEKISIFLRFWSHLRAYSKHHVHLQTRHDRVCFNVLGCQSAPTPTRHQQEIELGRSIIIRAR